MTCIFCSTGHACICARSQYIDNNRIFFPWRKEQKFKRNLFVTDPPSTYKGWKGQEVCQIFVQSFMYWRILSQKHWQTATHTSRRRTSRKTGKTVSDSPSSMCYRWVTDPRFRRSPAFPPTMSDAAHSGQMHVQHYDPTQCGLPPPPFISRGSHFPITFKFKFVDDSVFKSFSAK